MGYPPPLYGGDGALVLAQAGCGVLTDELGVDLADLDVALAGTQRCAVCVEVLAVGLVGHGGALGGLEDDSFQVVLDDELVLQHPPVVGVAVGPFQELDGCPAALDDTLDARVGRGLRDAELSLGFFVTGGCQHDELPEPYGESILREKDEHAFTPF